MEIMSSSDEIVVPEGTISCSTDATTITTPTIPKKLETLSKEIQAAYDAEIKLLSDSCGNNSTTISIYDKSGGSGNPKSIRQLMAEQQQQQQQQQPTTSTSTSTKLDVIRGWQELLSALIEYDVFLDYFHSLEEAFREIAESNGFGCATHPSCRRRSSSSTSSSNNSGRDTPTTKSDLWFTIQNNLVKLLTHTVQNHYRDDCTECRFVTILEVTLSYQSSITTHEPGQSSQSSSQSSQQQQHRVVYLWKPSDAVQRFWVRLMQPIHPDMQPFDFRRRAYGVLVSLSWVPSSKGLLEACSIVDSSSRGGTGHHRHEIPPATPLEAKRLLQKIPGGSPLPRNDSVYQVLDRLKDETNVSVVICASKYNNNNNHRHHHHNGTTTTIGGGAAATTGGIGKSTVAALVASHSLILRSFKVLWLNMDYNKHIINNIKGSSIVEEEEAAAAAARGGGGGATAGRRLHYEKYIEYLNCLYDQLIQQQQQHTTVVVERPKWPEVYSLKRLEEAAIRHRREENMMRRAQKLMSDLLDTIGGNILLVLDDLSHEDDLEWFHFVEKQSILATTSHCTGSSSNEDDVATAIHNIADFVVELDPWGEEESKELFLLEANIAESHVMISARELKEIVARCHYHPIIVRTAARLFLLKKVSAGLIQALLEASQELVIPGAEPASSSQASAFFDESDDSTTTGINTTTTPTTTSTPKALSVILDAALSPRSKRTQQPSVLFKLCLASMAAVFGESPKVPLTAVLLLWEQLFSMEPDAIEECGEDVSPEEIRRHVWFIAEGLTHMGLLSFTEDDDGHVYAAIHHDMYKEYALEIVDKMDLGSSTEGTRLQWHKAFVAAYLTRNTRKFEGNSSDGCHSYALTRLSQHMLHCKLYVQVVGLLSNGRLYQERIAAFGRDVATTLHVRDCIQLMQSIRGDPSIPREQRDMIADQHFHKVAKLITEEVDTSKESSSLCLAKNLYSIGHELASNGKFVEALDLYTQAQDLVPRGSSFAATVHYGVGSVNLILNSTSLATKSLMASIACMKILGEDGEGSKPMHPLYLEVSRLQAQALMAQCSYKIALSQFEDTLEQMKDDNFESKIEFGILMYWKGRLHQLMGDGARATTELEKCIKWKENMREKSRNLAAAHSALADTYADLGRIQDARREVDVALKTIEEVDAKWPTFKYHDDPHEADLEVKLLKAKFRSLRPDLPEDWSSYEFIREKIKSSPVLLMDQSAHDLRSIARVYMAADEHEKAAAVLEDALNLMASPSRSESLERALCLIDLGNSFMDQGETYDEGKKSKTMFELALKLFGLALNIQRPKLGECSQLLETLDAIGNLHVHLRKPELAISVYSEALTLAKKLRSDNEKIAGILYFLGECHEELGQHEPAENHYKECLMRLRSDRPSDDLDLARPLQRLGAISLVDGKYSDAKQLYDEILKIRDANFDPNEVLLAETRDVLTFIEMKRHNYESACHYLKQALDIRKQLQDVRAIADILYQIGLTFRLRGDHPNALHYFEQSLESMDGAVRKDDTLLVSVILAIGNTKINLGKEAEAARLCQRAMEVRTSKLGPDHRKTAYAARSLGVANFLQNHLEDASFFLQEYVRITERQPNLRKNNEYLIVLIMLSDIQEAHGRPKLGRKILATARDICTKDAAVIADFPKLKEMVDDRICGSKPITKDQEGGGSRVLVLDSEELDVFQKTVLTDD